MLGKTLKMLSKPSTKASGSGQEPRHKSRGRNKSRNESKSRCRSERSFHPESRVENHVSLLPEYHRRVMLQARHLGWHTREGQWAPAKGPACTRVACRRSAADRNPTSVSDDLPIVLAGTPVLRRVSLSAGHSACACLAPALFAVCFQQNNFCNAYLPKKISPVQR